MLSPIFKLLTKRLRKGQVSLNQLARIAGLDVILRSNCRGRERRVAAMVTSCFADLVFQQFCPPLAQAQHPLGRLIIHCCLLWELLRKILNVLNVNFKLSFELTHLICGLVHHVGVIWLLFTKPSDRVINLKWKRGRRYYIRYFRSQKKPQL